MIRAFIVSGIVALAMTSASQAGSRRHITADWPTDCIPAITTTVTSTAHIAVQFGGTGTYGIEYDLCELIYMQEGNTLTAHYEVWFRVVNPVGSLGLLTLIHDIPVNQGGQKLFGNVKWTGINLPSGYTTMIPLAGATGITFQMLGDGVPEINLKEPQLDLTVPQIRLMGTASWWVQN